MLADVVAPVRSALPPGAFLWTLRYAKRGEHLKVRVHAPEGERERLRREIEERAASALAALAPLPAEQRLSRSDSPPIDAEDSLPDEAPDLAFEWTGYRRSPVTLGGEPFPRDDEYVARFTRCLGAGTDVVLAALPPAFGDELPHRLRQTTLLKSLLNAFAALEWPAERRREYLDFHRDWLLRYLLARSNADLERGGIPAETLARFDAKAAAMPQVLAALSRIAAAGGEAAADDGATGGWAGAVRQLAADVEARLDQPAYRIDPFTDELVFPPLFKAFHGLSNQLGLNMPEEAFAHHLLSRAIAPAAAAPEAPQAGEERRPEVSA
jgi:hypothetical protein